MPRGGNCNHRRCDGGPCKQLTDEELTPSQEDEITAKMLVDDGWLSISTNYRTVALATDAVPTVEDMIHPEMLDTPFGKELAEYWIRHRRSMLRCCNDDSLVMTQDLTLRVWRAFKKLGGSSA